ncbi:MAG: 4Fe-4S binding protein [Phycisphaerae bacterium]
MIREIVTIDEDLCNGCGECVPSCAEGAIQIIDGKARLVSDTLCDGLGACLGHCPQGAIKIERREATAFDEPAARRHLAGLEASVSQPHQANEEAVTTPGAEGPAGHAHGGCPSSRFARLERAPRRSDTKTESGLDPGDTDQDSELTHWPVQLRLLPPAAPVLQGARLLVAADCVPFAYRGFHTDLLRDHVVVVACPKLDDPTGYVEKLTEMIRHNDLAEITVARMEVPCCGGILQMVLQARQLAESDVSVNDVLISIRGEVLARRQISIEPKVSCSSRSTCCTNTGAN